MSNEGIARLMLSKLDTASDKLDEAVRAVRQAGIAFSRINPNDDEGFADFAETVETLSHESNAIKSWIGVLEKENL